MSFYEVIYETPGVDEAIAGKNGTNFQTGGGEGRARTWSLETVDYFVASCVLSDGASEVGSSLTRGVRARRFQRSAALSFG